LLRHARWCTIKTASTSNPLQQIEGLRRMPAGAPGRASIRRG
jgi:hypothetical protein